MSKKSATRREKMKGFIIIVCLLMSKSWAIGGVSNFDSQKTSVKKEVHQKGSGALVMFGTSAVYLGVWIAKQFPKEKKPSVSNPKGIITGERVVSSVEKSDGERGREWIDTESIPTMTREEFHKTHSPVVQAQ